jgi:outer membrane lipoprotein-sorting protein
MRTPYIPGLIFAAAIILTSSYLRADEQGKALLRECVAATRHVQSMQAEYTLDGKLNGQPVHKQGKFSARKGNLVHDECRSPKYGTNVVVNSDGVRLTYYSSADKTYSIEKVNKNNIIVNVGTQELKVFLQPDLLEQAGELDEPTIGKSVVIDGVACRSLVFAAGDYVTKYFIGPDGLVRGSMSKLGDIIGESRLKNLKVNPTLLKEVFSWKPPKDAKRTE